MTITSFVSQRMTTMPTEDPQQQAMMRSMAFMPLMYLFFFVNTPAGLVLYWLTSNVFSMFQQYFTVGLACWGATSCASPAAICSRRGLTCPAPPGACRGAGRRLGQWRADGNDNHIKMAEHLARRTARSRRNASAAAWQPGQGEETWQALRPPVLP